MEARKIKPHPYNQKVIDFGLYSLKKTYSQVVIHQPKYCSNLFSSEYGEDPPQVQIFKSYIAFQYEYGPCVTAFIDNLDNFYDFKELKQIVGPLKISEKKIHQAFNYTPLCVKEKMYKVHGFFYNYFARKYMSIISEIDFLDPYAEALNQHNNSLNVKNYYENVKNEKQNIFNVMGDLFYTSLSLIRLHLEDSKPYVYNEAYFNKENLRCLQQYIETLPREMVLLKPCFETPTLSGQATIITKDILVDIKYTKNENNDLKYFYRPLLYCALLYNECKRKINLVEVYNPQHGKVYSIDITEWFNEEKLLGFARRRREAKLNDIMYRNPVPIQEDGSEKETALDSGELASNSGSEEENDC